MLPAVYPQLGWIYRGGLVAVAIFADLRNTESSGPTILQRGECGVFLNVNGSCQGVGPVLRLQAWIVAGEMKSKGN